MNMVISYKATGVVQRSGGLRGAIRSEASNTLTMSEV
jgi:hypothetical protein